MSSSDDWNACLPWDGNEKSLPLGGYVKIPDLKVTSFVMKYVVLRDDEMVTIPREEVKKGDVIIDAEMNDALFDRLAATYGEDVIKISESGDVGSGISRKAWKEQYGTDGLKLWALRNARMKLSGSGVHIL